MQAEIARFERYLKQRYPGRSTSKHYMSDLTIFQQFVGDVSPKIITSKVVSAFVEAQSTQGLKAAQKKAQPVPVFLIIDDSLVEKTGKKMEGVAKHYSHTEDKLVLGHVWVTGQLVVMGHSYPFSWRLYRRQSECETAGEAFFSKPALAEAIVREFEPLPDTQTYVLTDEK